MAAVKALEEDLADDDVVGIIRILLEGLPRRGVALGVAIRGVALILPLAFLRHSRASSVGKPKPISYSYPWQQSRPSLESRDGTSENREGRERATTSR